jgi:hypothetical protein
VSEGGRRPLGTLPLAGPRGAGLLEKTRERERERREWPGFAPGRRLARFP